MVGKARWGVALLALLVAACGGGPPVAPAVAPVPAPLDLSGVVLLQRNPGHDDVVFADPATGVVKTTLPLPGRDTSPTRFDGPASKLDLVSPDGQYATLESGGGVDVFKLDRRGRRYERTGTVAGFRNPRFGPMGTKLYFDDGRAVYSTDYTRPGQNTEEAGLVPPDDPLDPRVQAWWPDAQGTVLTWKDVRRAGGLAYLTDSSGAIGYATYDDAGTRYYFVTALDAVTVLLYAVGGTDAHGALARLKVDDGVPQVTKLVDRAEPRIGKAAAAPDRATVLYQTTQGEWFDSPTTPGAITRPALKQLPAAGERQLVGWA
ncbi:MULTISPECIES: hypothetical protein [unclassified Amycolatopsis]|uniref:hypothetical protein n=1 Tax=unclassified Amycolatopsis TaxID=2618356 RepID=UPI002E122A39|nr:MULTISPECIES: hypothetical protein [unclassified Amycolatopsis]WSJ74326.1 hypothetical protein OG439_33390 [Amycolatopsis sp. NBC_01307]WSK82024.1 hypothetical protein OG570_16280 [Amycolatopsis sp. NBC_01286]